MLSSSMMQSAESNGSVVGDSDYRVTRGSITTESNGLNSSSMVFTNSAHAGKDELKCKTAFNGNHSKSITMKEKRECISSNPRVKYTGGYVRRLAAKNASACVNAMLESTKKSKKSTQTHASSNGTSLLLPSKSYTTSIPQDDQDSVKRSARKRTNKGNVVDVLEKKTKVDSSLVSGKLTTNGTENCDDVDDSMQQSPTVSSSSSSPPPTRDDSCCDSIVLSDSGSEINASSIRTGDSDLQQSEVTNHCIYEYCDDFPFTLGGILYNGDCMHSDALFFLKSDSCMVPNRIVPCVIPLKSDSISSLKGEQCLDSKNKSLKGDNGWSAVGTPIKYITINVGKGKKIQRKYFIGIRRKQEILFVRDSVLLRSGNKKDDVPFVAKISSIWQESGGLMVTVFWYYRKEDTDSNTSSQFMEMEVMASQHHDDLSVACIDDKCRVLGMADFYRFKAKLERFPQFKSIHSNSKPKQELTGNIGLDTQFRELAVSEVYLCFRAYNHISGKIVK